MDNTGFLPPPTMNKAPKTAGSLTTVAGPSFQVVDMAITMITVFLLDSIVVTVVQLTFHHIYEFQRSTHFETWWKQNVTLAFFISIFPCSFLLLIILKQDHRARNWKFLFFLFSFHPLFSPPILTHHCGPGHRHHPFLSTLAWSVLR